MRIAIVSDIHANLAAFEAVLAHAKSIGYDRMVCLGDVVGYGPDPVECIDLVREHCEWSLLGNHDFAALYEPSNFNKAAREAVFWTRSETLEGGWMRRQIAAALAASQPAPADRDRVVADFETKQRERVDFMFRISPRKVLLDRYICVHASPSRPVNEYLFAEDVNDNGSKLPRNFRLLTLPGSDGRDRPASALVGHTHCPGFILEEPPDPVEVARREAEATATAASAEGPGASFSALLREESDRYGSNRYDWVPFPMGVGQWTPTEDDMPEGCRFILNPGSVGQPRDHDPRSSYVMLETDDAGGRDRFTFHRVAYDVARTQERIRAFAAQGAPLSEWLAKRLEEGQ